MNYSNENRCANTEALNKHMDEIDKEEKAYEAMQSDLMEQFEFETFDLKERFDKIVAKYGFEYSFCTFIEDM